MSPALFMSFKMMEGDFLGNQEEGGSAATLMHTGLSLQNHAATYILMLHARARTHVHTHNNNITEVYIECLMGK